MFQHSAPTRSLQRFVFAQMISRKNDLLDSIAFCVVLLGPLP